MTTNATTNTTSTASTTTPTKATPSLLSTYVTWFETHERLFLLLAVLIFGAYAVNRWHDYLIKHDQTQATIATQQAQTAAQKAQNDDTRDQQLNQQLAQLQSSYNSLSLQLSKSMQQRATSTQAQIQTDDKSDAAALASRIHTLLGVGTITVETQDSPVSSTLVYSLDAAHADADNLEDLQQAKGDLNDTKNQLVACSTLTGKQTDTINALNGQIADEKNALVTEQNAHQADVKLLNAKNKKSFWKGVKTGVEVVIGVIAGVKLFK